MITLVLCLVLSGVGKDYTLLLTTVASCMIVGIALAYLDPVISFLHELDRLISLDHSVLQTLLKSVGIGIIGEIASMICTDSGNGALGKALQLFTTILILWLSLPLLQTLLKLVQEILEGL